MASTHPAKVTFGPGRSKGPTHPASNPVNRGPSRRSASSTHDPKNTANQGRTGTPRLNAAGK